jgi:hypothetical protein
MDAKSTRETLLQMIAVKARPPELIVITAHDVRALLNCRSYKRAKLTRYHDSLSDRIAGALANLGYHVSEQTVENMLETALPRSGTEAKLRIQPLRSAIIVELWSGKLYPA